MGMKASALLSVTHDWMSNIDEGSDVCSVYFDLRKALDSVAHCMISILIFNGCHVGPNMWLQMVNVLMFSLSFLWSVLGPLLILIFIDDVVTQISPGSQLSLFADTIQLDHQSITQFYNMTQHCGSKLGPCHSSLKNAVPWCQKRQKFGLRLCFKDWLSDYNDLLSRANLPSFERRITRARLYYIYKITNDLIDYPSGLLNLREYSYSS